MTYPSKTPLFPVCFSERESGGMADALDLGFVVGLVRRAYSVTRARNSWAFSQRAAQFCAVSYTRCPENRKSIAKVTRAVK
jgi:hypothetical protein